MKRITTLIIAVVLQTLAACSPSFQTTSGKDYLANSPVAVDKDIAKAAAIEPNLRLPARIGFARIINGEMTAIPAVEVQALSKLAEDHKGMGEFVPISPLVAAMIGTTSRNTAGTIKQIRLTAARQHLDYVVIYEVGARSSRKNTPFALADVTLIGGMLLPTRKIDVQGVGQAIFLDVRNAYPYATVGVTTDLTGFARTFQGDRRSSQLRDKAVAAVVVELAPQLDQMLTGITQRARRR